MSDNPSIRYHVSMTKIQQLQKILIEFSYYDEMYGIAFKPRAYKLAAESVSVLNGEIENTWRKGGIKALKKFPGIGQSIAEKIDEFFRTGKIKEYQTMKKKFPVDIWSLSRIERLGPKHIHDLYEYLNVRNLSDLKKALKTHKVQTIPRWGAKSEKRLARNLGLTERASDRRLLSEILPYAHNILTALSQVKGVKHCTIAGSIRRRRDTIGDIDLLATSSDPDRVMDAFTSLPLVETIHERGKTRSSIRLRIGIDVDLRVVHDEVYGAALQYFTGNARHNILLREYALSKGYTLNEYGLFQHKKNSLIVCKTEEEIYTRLGMDTPPPEIRIGDDEIDAAREHRIPRLIPYGSVKGDMHVHTEWTDGTVSIKKMITAAKKVGLSYVAITDHTKSLAYIHGLNEKRILEQIAEIKKLNKEIKKFTIFSGTECDILKDGTLDISDKVLAKLDWVGISIHSYFTLSRKEQTKRIVAALSNPNVDCLFHPTCRLIGKRKAIDYDIDEIITTAKKHRVALEIDAYPNRSDLRDIHVRAAVQAGVKLTIDTDAHTPEDFRFISLGEAIARRGWATKTNILNTKKSAELRAYLQKKRSTKH